MMPREWWHTDFDPMQELIEHKRHIQQLNHNIIEVAKAHNQTEEAMAELVKQHNQLIEEIKKLKAEIQSLRQNP